MKKSVVLFILSFSLLFGQMEGLKIQKDLPTALKLAKKEQKDILLFIYSNHCWYCNKMKKNTFSNKKVIEMINENFIFVMEEDYSKNLSNKYKTDFVPITYIIGYEDNDVLLELPGHKDIKTFIQIIPDYIF